MSTYIHYTNEQKERARSTDLADLLQRQGEQLKRSGKEYQWRDGSNKVTIRGNLWYHQYEEVGGDAIDFVRRFYNKDYPEAMEYLLNGYGGTLTAAPPIEKDIKEFELPKRNDNMRRVYAYLLHHRGLSRDENWKTPLRKRYRPCECCRKEYTTALRERNLDILERTQYTYVYTPNSKVFHKCSCGKMLSAKNILGARKYDTVIKTGRIPCKLCNPSPSDIYKLLPPEVKIARLQKKIKKSANVTDKRAIARQKLAVEERYRLLNDENLTQTEKDDIYTLTQPRFAFWVGKGYQTFHLRSCSKLNEISNLRGFGTYKEAIHAGYTPCRQCKPTSKHDVKVSIPFTNRVRLDENLLDIKTMCEDAGYLFNQETEYIYIETPVGKWKIKTSKVPVKLEHINLATNPGCKTYHDQPRIFLSFIDTFDYIKRHDEKLLREKEEGKVYVKFISKD